MDILTGAQMRSFEQAAMASGRATGLDLMERAGRGVVEAVFACWPGLEDGARSALVLCGPGNNGGDGFVIARLLHRRGWRVEGCLLGDRARLPADAATNARRWEEIGEVHRLTDEVLEGRSEKPALIVDALFGSGLSRAFTGFPKLRRTINRLRETDAPEKRLKIVAVDVPSGLCCDSGRFPGYEGEDGCTMPILADLTVTFHRPKAGHYLANGPHACGRLAIADIGL